MNATDTRVNPALGAYRFSFGVIGDTHINQSENESASPYECNKLANGRAQWAVDRLNREGVDFTIHLGDIVNPVPHLNTYADAIGCFHEIFGKLEQPYYIVPGNHDIGDKPVDWMPASNVSTEFINQFEDTHGKHFDSFEHKDCRFILLNAQLFNSGLEEEGKQQKWFTSELEKSKDQRSFVFLHYPPFITRPDEPTNYDNIDEPARSWFLEACVRNNVTALYAGHVHNLMYNRYETMDTWVLPSTSFLRLDYSEMFKAAPTADLEFGRNDGAKMGFFVVRVYENGQVAQLVRSHGAVMRPDEEPARTPLLRGLHSDEAIAAPVGFELRHPWNEEMDIPANGAIEEFERKRVRNDYALFALWEMGAASFRAPLQDLLEPGARKRIGNMVSKGQTFVFYRYGLPEASERKVLSENKDLVRAIEITLRPDKLEQAISDLKVFRDETGVPVRLSLMRTGKGEGKAAKFKHSVEHGFLPDEKEDVKALFENAGIKAAVEGVVFRVSLDLPALESIQEISALANELGIRASVMLRIAPNSLREVNDDEAAICTRVAETLAAGHLVKNLDIYFDTFIDVDRSYFVRKGFYDRLYNPRLAAHVFRTLNTVFQQHLPDSVEREGENLKICSDKETMVFSMGGSLSEIEEGNCFSIPNSEAVPLSKAGVMNDPVLVFIRND